jgi:hypothetical protein
MAGIVDKVSVALPHLVSRLRRSGQLSVMGKAVKEDGHGFESDGHGYERWAWL